MSRVRQLLLLLGLLLPALASCAGGLGSSCGEDGDCRTGLRCARSSSGRGVCTYPPSGPEPSVDQRLDRDSLDRGRTDGGDARPRDAASDRARSD